MCKPRTFSSFSTAKIQITATTTKIYQKKEYFCTLFRLIMSKKAQKSNKQFLYGTGALAFGVICIVFLFIYLTTNLSKVKVNNEAYGDIYQIEFSKNFIGDSTTVYINDSLLWSAKVNTDTIKIRVNRFSEQNMLMVSDHEKEITSSFNLANQGARLILDKQAGFISITTITWE